MTTYYVSSIVGSDNNAGTSAGAPLGSLQAAEGLVKPGDTVQVMNGTYTGPGGGNVLTISTSGTASAPITFEAAPGATPVIDSTNMWQGIEIDASYITIKGLTVVGGAANYNLSSAMAGYSTGNAALDGNGIAATSGELIHNIIIENNTVYNESGGGIAINNGDYIQILNNNVHDNAHWSAYGASGISILGSQNFDNGPAPHIIVSGNTSVNNSELVPEYRAGAITDGEGIILDSNQGYTGGFLVENNTTTGNGGPGIESFFSDNAVITGNTSYGNDTQNTQAANVAEIFINQSNNDTVTNNITTATNPPPPANPPPAAPVISNDAVSGNIVTLNGTAAANSAITVFDNSTKLGAATQHSSGTWTFTTGARANGSQSFTATATDAAGNVSPLSSALVVTMVGSSGSTGSSGGNLVTNGSFETDSLGGWTVGGNSAVISTGPQLSVDKTAESGAYAAGMGSMGSDGTLSQTIATTAGKTYTLSFWLQNEASGTNDFKATWNGQTLLSLTNAAQSGYKQYTYTVTATGSASTLQFSAMNDPSQWDLDNISLTANGTSSPPPTTTPT